MKAKKQRRFSSHASIFKKHSNKNVSNAVQLGRDNATISIVASTGN